MKVGNILITLTFLCLAGFTSCKKDDLPPVENKGKVITNVTLIFNPTEGGAPLTFTASDPDGEGSEEIETGTINLPANSSFQLFIKLDNSITDEDVTLEVQDEGTAHLLFFGFTQDIFSQPPGIGNIENREGHVNYIDEDDNGLPIGLITGWQTGDPGNGTFTIVLKHQKDIKSETSTSQDGITDLNLTWELVID